MRTLLFLCTGNYYRSRFAEEFFNMHAPERCPGWRSLSRGIAIDLGTNNVGPMALSAAEALRLHGLVDFDRRRARMPCQLQVIDLDAADHIVALKKAEHLPLLRERFDAWLATTSPERVEYWHVDDVDELSPDEALPAIAAQVTSLMARLASSR